MPIHIRRYLMNTSSHSVIRHIIDDGVIPIMVSPNSKVRPS